MEFRKEGVKFDTKIAVHVVQIDEPLETSSLSALKCNGLLLEWFEL